MTNIPAVKLGLVAVSRDCFPIELSRRRRTKVAAECRRLGLKIAEIPTVVENEAHALEALDKLRAAGANALVLYLGNFGPEGPTTILAQRFGGPVMFAAAAEETAQRPHRRPRRRLLRHAQRLLQHRPAQAAALHPRVSRRHGRGGRGDDRRLRPGRPRPARAQGPQGLRLRPPAAGLPGLQRPDQAALRPRRRGHGELRARPLRRLPCRPKGRARSRPSPRTWPTSSGAGNAYPDLLAKLAQFEVGLTKFMKANLGASTVRRLCRQVLAGLREVLRLRALLRQHAPGRPRHPRGLRGGHLRRPERVHGRLRDDCFPPRCSTSTTPSRPTWSKRAARPCAATSRPTCSWASTAATRRPAA